MSHIFISHSTNDKEYVRELAAELRNRGFEVWLDDKAIRAGQHWMAELEQAVEDCAALIVVMTSNSRNPKSWVHNEISLARELEKPILPLLLEGRKFFSLANVQYTDVTNKQLPRERFYETLAQAAPPIPARVQPTPTKSRPDILTISDPFPKAAAMELIRIPAGEFLMGSDPGQDEDAQDDEQPQHTLTLPDYYIAKYPVRVAQFQAFVKATNYQPGDEDSLKGEPDHPVVWVSWNEAVAFCRWLSQQSGHTVRLSTETEWEKAAWGTAGRIYPWGEGASTSSLPSWSDLKTCPQGRGKHSLR